MSPMSRAVAVLAGILLTASHPRAAPSNGLEARAARALRAGDFRAATDLFEQALGQDPESAGAHYGLARALARARAAGQVCTVNAFRETIREHLEAAVRLDPRRQAQVEQEPDLAAVRDTVWFQALAGRPATDARNVPALLVKVSWYGSTGEGIYSSLVRNRLEFSSAGTVALHVVDVDGERTTARAVEGRYRLTGRKVHIELGGGTKGTRTNHEGILTGEGVLEIPGLDRFRDDHDECSS